MTEYGFSLTHYFPYIDRILDSCSATMRKCISNIMRTAWVLNRGKCHYFLLHNYCQMDKMNLYDTESTSRCKREKREIIKTLQSCKNKQIPDF